VISFFKERQKHIPGYRFLGIDSSITTLFKKKLGYSGVRQWNLKPGSQLDWSWEVINGVHTQLKMHSNSHCLITPKEI
jgi:hypothetical protein